MRKLESDLKNFPLFYLGEKTENQPMVDDVETFHGIDNNGMPLHVKRWKMELTIDNETATRSHVHNLMNINHENIRSIVNVASEHDSIDCITYVYLAHKPVNGLTIKTLSKLTKWTTRLVREFASAILQGLLYLKKHNMENAFDINESSVLFDENGVWKMVDCSHFLNLPIFPQQRNMQMNLEKSASKALGDLIKSLGVTANDAIGFIEKCEKGSNLEELIDDPFIKNLNRSIDDFIVIQQIGRGGFSDVLKVEDPIDGQFYAIKRLKIDRTKKNNQITLHTANKEVKTLASLDHKYIVRYKSKWMDSMKESDYKTYKNCSVSADMMDVDCSAVLNGPSTVRREKIIHVMYIQMEFCSGGNLSEVIGGYELKDNILRLRKLFFGIVDAIKYIHSKNIIHRDLKPKNIFLTGNDTIRLGDFGLATTRVSLSKIKCGTQYYMAPEIGKKGVTARADMYSLGIILFEMCYPMAHFRRDEILNKIREPAAPIEDFIPMPTALYNVIKNLLDHEPKNRFTATTLLKQFPGYKRELDSVLDANTLTDK